MTDPTDKQPDMFGATSPPGVVFGKDGDGYAHAFVCAQGHVVHAENRVGGELAVVLPCWECARDWILERWPMRRRHAKEGT